MLLESAAKASVRHRLRKDYRSWARSIHFDHYRSLLLARLFTSVTNTWHMPLRGERFILAYGFGGVSSQSWFCWLQTCDEAELHGGRSVWQKLLRWQVRSKERRVQVPGITFEELSQSLPSSKQAPPPIISIPHSPPPKSATCWGQVFKMWPCPGHIIFKPWQSESKKQKPQRTDGPLPNQDQSTNCQPCLLKSQLTPLSPLSHLGVLSRLDWLLLEFCATVNRANQMTGPGRALAGSSSPVCSGDIVRGVDFPGVG